MTQDEQKRFEQLSQELEKTKRSVEVVHASFRRSGYEVKLYQGFLFFLLAVGSLAAISALVQQ
jgi:hypothetical protein